MLERADAAIELTHKPIKIRSAQSSRRAYAFYFLAPMVVVLLMTAGWPLLRTLFFGFTDANLSDLDNYKFIGFENYYASYEGESFGLLADREWWRAVLNTLTFTGISVTLETILGMVVALVLHASFKGRGLLRAAILIPWAIPTIVSAKMWAWILHDQFGLLNDMLLTLGILSEPLAWTADPQLSMSAIILVDVWKTTPFMALLLLAALQMLPSDCYEAAKVDGIHPIRVFFQVTLPLIRPAVMVAIIFRALDALRIFDLIYVLTSNSVDTMSMSVYARQQLVDFQEVGYGSAASTLLFLIIALCIALYITLGRVKLAED